MEGIVTLSTTFCYPEAEQARFVRSAHPVFSIMIHPKIFVYIGVQDVSDPEEPRSWTFFLFLSWLGEKDESLSNEQKVKDVREKAAGLAEASSMLVLPSESGLTV